MITLPTSPAPTSGQPFLRDFGGVLTPFLGGPEQRINRVGTRFGIRVQMPTMESADEGRVFISRLLRAREDVAEFPWPLNDFDPGSPGTPLVKTAETGGTNLEIKGLTASYAIKEGQFFSVTHSGQSYVYMFAADAAADGLGDATTTIYPSLRTALSVDDVIDIAAPMIEGFVSPGDELAWEISSIKRVGISFSIVERA